MTDTEQNREDSIKRLAARTSQQHPTQKERAVSDALQAVRKANELRAQGNDQGDSATDAATREAIRSTALARALTQDIDPAGDYPIPTLEETVTEQVTRMQAIAASLAGNLQRLLKERPQETV